MVYVPVWQASRVPWYDAESFQVENEARKTAATILGGLAVLIGLIFTYAQLKAFEKTVEITQSGQITENISKAVDQLASEKLEVRLGAIYVLERLARSSESDHWPIIEILSAYVREHATSKNHSLRETTQPDTSKKYGPGLKLDLQAVLTALGRRDRSHREGRMNLYRVVLPQAILEHAELPLCILTEANLEESNLLGVRLSSAEISLADFGSAHMTSALLDRATGLGTQFVKADIRHADFTHADLQDASFAEADLSSAVFCSANLSGVDFRAANLAHADFKEADLRRADLRGVDLTYAQNLTREQIREARTDDMTLLPETG